MMIRFFLFIMVLVFAAGAVYSAKDEGSKIFPYKINQVTLDNGLKIVSIPVVRTGSRNEIEPGKSGFAHFFEHMMFRGTDKYPKVAFNNLLKSIGADNN